MSARAPAYRTVTRAATGAAAASGGTAGGRAGPWPRAFDDAGAGTVLVLGLVAAAMLALTGVGGIGVAALTGTRAAAAADLAALAGADVLLGRAGGTPCGAAGRVAAANDAELGSCTLHHQRLGGSTVATSVQVEVAVVAPGAVGRLGPARATARAGLVEPGADPAPGGAEPARSRIG